MTVFRFFNVAFNCAFQHSMRAFVHCFTSELTKEAETDALKFWTGMYTRRVIINSSKRLKIILQLEFKVPDNGPGQRSNMFSHSLKSALLQHMLTSTIPLSDNRCHHLYFRNFLPHNTQYLSHCPRQIMPFPQYSYSNQYPRLYLPTVAAGWRKRSPISLPEEVPRSAQRMGAVSGWFPSSSRPSSHAIASAMVYGVGTCRSCLAGWIENVRSEAHHLESTLKDNKSW